MHDVDVEMPDGRTQGLEVVGPWDAGAGAFRTIAFDGAGAVEHATADADPDGWTFRAGAGPERAEARLTADPDGRRLHGAWSRTTDDGATWTPWMRLTLERRD